MNRNESAAGSHAHGEMPVRPTLRRRLLMAAAMLAVSLLIAGEPLIRSFEYSIYDWRVQKLLPIPATSRDVVVIGIDDESLERMEPAVTGCWCSTAIRR